MNTAKGSIVVDEIILPIADIRLSRRAFVMTAHVRGPVPAVSTGSYVVCDSEGAVVYRRDTDDRRYFLEWAAMPANSGLTVTVTLEIAEMRAGPVTNP